MSTREPSRDPGTERPRAEQVFFDDPALDRVMGVLLALATEHCVLRDRVRVLERSRAPDDDGVQDESDDAAQGAEDAAFAEALLRPLLGIQQSNGATGTFTLAGRRRP